MAIGIEQYRLAIGLRGFPPVNKRPPIALRTIVFNGFGLTKGTVLIVVFLLLLSGDVEVNPGPGPRRFESPAYSGQHRVNTSAMETNTGNIEARSPADTFRFSGPQDCPPGNNTNNISNSELILLEIRKINQQFDDFRAEVKNWQLQMDNRITTVEHSVANVMDKLDDLENRSRRNNLLFFGVDDKPGETWKESEQKVREGLKEKLTFTSEDVSAMEFERVHRIGTYKAGKQRPIIAMFSRYQHKDKVFIKAREICKFKDQFYVKQDYSDRVKEARKQLAPYFDKALKENRHPKIVMDRLIVDGLSYKYDHSTNTIKPVSKK